MFLRIDRFGAVELHEPADKRRFSVRLAAGAEVPASGFARAGRSVRFETADVAWVSVASLRRWPDMACDPAWSADIDALVEKARSFGWTNAQATEVRAHVERERAASDAPVRPGGAGQAETPR